MNDHLEKIHEFDIHTAEYVLVQKVHIEFE
jgi:hypothetical protein